MKTYLSIIDLYPYDAIYHFIVIGFEDYSIGQYELSASILHILSVISKAKGERDIKLYSPVQINDDLFVESVHYDNTEILFGDLEY